MRVTGLRGVGKTVLLGEFGDEAKKLDWATTYVELLPGQNTDRGLVAALTDALKGTRDDLSRVERLKSAVGSAARKTGTLGLAWGDFQVTYQPGVTAEQQDLPKALFETVESAVHHGWEGLVLLLDEAQVIRDETRPTGQHPLSTLIASVSSLQKAQLPVGLVLCGLPTLTGNLLRARSYTERMFRGEMVDSLGPDDAREAFLRPLVGTPVHVEDGLAERVVDEVEGYPYFVQLWGAELWDAAVDAEVADFSQRLLDEVRREIFRRLDFDFYEPRVSTLTPAEQDVLLATAECEYPPLIVSDLNAAVQKTPGNVNVLLGRLVDSGVLYRVRKGQYEYTAPKFRDYLLRRAGPQNQPSLLADS
jgi:DNA-binding transcriptional ArsR family regulator